ncbi:MAG: hypothetical protein WBG50_21570 [Desulfomonilaceae bacterium]
MITRILRALCIVGLLALCLVLPAAGQQTIPSLGPAAAPSASASPAVPSIGIPSAVRIRRNIVTQQIAAVNSQIRVAQQCISNASKPEVLRDVQGNVNIVPSLDITNCTRTLLALERQLTSLTIKANRLAADAQTELAAFQARQRQQQAARNLKRKAGAAGFAAFFAR